MALIALASIGYFSGHFAHKEPPAPSAGVAETDPTELAKREPIKDFILTDAEGKQKKLSDFRGNVVVLSFWASWCTPCLVELPTFAELEKKYHDRGLRILAVNVDEGDDGKKFAHDFWAREKFTFPSFFDTHKELSQQFEIEMLPSNFVIDRQGRLVFSGFGANDWSNSQTTEFLEGLLQEPAQESSSQEPSADATAKGG